MTTAPRLLDWPERLAAALEERTSRPFAWGTDDCVTFAADVVLALTGVDVLASVDRWRNERDAARALRHLGGLKSATCWALGLPIDPALAGPGDILLVNNAGREVLAMCNGQTALVPGEHGLLAISDPDPVAAWRIG